MAKPLDKQSKFMGIFKVSNIYFLGGVMGFFLVSFHIWAHLFGFFPTVIIGIVVLSVTITYIGVSNSYPEGFFLYWLQFNSDSQVFIPGFEPIKQPKKKGK